LIQENRQDKMPIANFRGAWTERTRRCILLDQQEPTHVSPRKKQVIQIHSSRLFKHILTGYHLQYE